MVPLQVIDQCSLAFVEGLVRLLVSTFIEVNSGDLGDRGLLGWRMVLEALDGLSLEDQRLLAQCMLLDNQFLGPAEVESGGRYQTLLLMRVHQVLHVLYRIQESS